MTRNPLWLGDTARLLHDARFLNAFNAYFWSFLPIPQCVSSSDEPSPQGYLLTANWYLVREDGLIQGGTNAGRAASRPLGVRP